MQGRMRRSAFQRSGCTGRLRQRSVVNGHKHLFAINHIQCPRHIAVRNAEAWRYDQLAI